MRQISYNKLSAIPDAFRPLPIANKSLPYNQLADARRFEELLYSVYASEIQHAAFNGFDDILLMSGVRDQGRDCALLKNGKNHGLIQCKKYARAYSKNDFGMEITKFVLYSLLQPALIHDPDDFTYYIAVSTGLVLNCNQLIDDFNDAIREEKSLDKWISENLKQPELNVLNLRDRKAEVLDILTRIRVQRIQPLDLDSLLFEGRNRHLLPLFFQVVTVTDNNLIQNLEKKIQEHFHKRATEEQIRSELIRSSVMLSSNRNEFEGIPSSHVPRTETEQLFSWIKSPARKDSAGNEENICLLAANAGLGKTVIMRDLYHRLKEENIPVLALKTDRLYADSLKSLQDKIGMSLPIYEFIEECKQLFPQLVILIDQIDALSQTLSADRSFLTTYTQLIQNYKYDPSVRIIISVRIFDLYYDPSLKVYNQVKSFEVKPLEEKVVLSLLTQLGITRSNISQGLFDLIRTPAHFDVFSRIYKADRNFAGISTIQDLYNELWITKIINNSIDAADLPSLIYGITAQMYQTQQITVSESRYERQHKELAYLKTERLVKTEREDLQFFHQTFYDFVFARSFVESNQSISSFLTKQKQSIMVRSALKMILTYLRAFDHANYIAQIDEMLKASRLYFHIKHLIITVIASQEHPSEQEIAIVTSQVMQHPLFAEIFIEQCSGKKWLFFLMDNGYLTGLLDPAVVKESRFIKQLRRSFSMEFGNKSREVEDRNRRLAILFHFLRKNAHFDVDRVIKFLPTTNEKYLIFRTIYNIKDWENPAALAILDQFNEQMPESSWGYYSLLEQVSEVNPDYVFEKMRTKFFKKEDRLRNSNVDHHEKELYKLLFDKIPEKICPYVLERILVEIPLHTHDTGQNRLIGDHYTGAYNLDEDEHAPGNEYFFQLFALELRKQAQLQTPFFKKFLKENLLSGYYSLIRLVIFVLQGNEHLYSDEIYRLIIYLSFSRDFYIGGLDTDVRFLMKAAYPYFSQGQKDEIKSKILAMVNKYELFKSHWEGKRIQSHWGQTQLLWMNALPENERDSDFMLKRKFQELNRRYPGFYEKPRQRGLVIAGVVGRPLDEKAYEVMTPKNWISSFTKYHANYNPHDDRLEDGRFRGGMTQHAQGFEKFCQANPETGLIIITEGLKNPQVDIFYSLRGLVGIAESGKYKTECLPLFKEIISRPLDDTGYIFALQLARQLTDDQNYNEDVFRWLKEQALNNPNPKTEQLERRSQLNRGTVAKDAQYGLSTVRGSAARAIVHIQDKRHEKEIFETIEAIFDRDETVVKATAMIEFAFLMNLNGARAFDLFISVVSDKKNADVLSSTFWSLQYLVNYDFKKLVPLFNTLIATKGMKDEDYSNLSSILFGAWARGYPGAAKPFKSLMKKHPAVQSHAINDAMKYLYFDDVKSPVSEEIVRLILEGEKTEQNKDISLYFSHMEDLKFEDVYPIAFKYINSPFFKFRETFLEYLVEHSATFPCECTDLFELAINRKTPKDDDDQNEFMGSEELATKFIVGAFNALQPTRITLHKKYRVKLLRAFDKVLADARFRSAAEVALEKVIA